MNPVLHTLLEGIVDYAGLFPPAALEMARAVENYAGYRESGEAWMLGRLVVPVSRLEEFEAAATPLLPARPGAPWLLSALGGTRLEQDVRAIGEFNCRHAADGAGAATIDGIEFKADDPAAIRAALAAIPAWLQAYVEVPLEPDPAPLLAAIAAGGGRAKARTGGVTPDAFPTAEQLARFLDGCVRTGLAFKATAGLHHPLRGTQRLTYRPDSPSAPMYGFLNVFLAASLLRQGLDRREAAELLLEESPEAIRLDGEQLVWRGHRLDRGGAAEARRQAISFGSCSFREPVDDLAALRLL